MKPESKPGNSGDPQLSPCLNQVGVPYRNSRRLPPVTQWGKHYSSTNQFAEMGHNIGDNHSRVIAGAISIVAYQSGISKTMTGALLVVSFVWALIVHVKLWRCPSCNGHLGRLYLGLKLPKFCPHCGIRLFDE